MAKKHFTISVPDELFYRIKKYEKIFPITKSKLFQICLENYCDLVEKILVVSSGGFDILKKDEITPGDLNLFTKKIEIEEVQNVS